MTTLSLNDQGQSFPQFHPDFSKHQEGDRSHLCWYPPFKWSMSLTDVAYTLSLTFPHRKKSRGVRSGDLGGMGSIPPNLPVRKMLIQELSHLQGPMRRGTVLLEKHFRIGISVQLGNTKCFQQVQIVILVDSFLFKKIGPYHPISY